MKMILKGWKFGIFVGSFVGLIGAALYPVVVYPFFHVEEYKAIQKRTRQGIDQESIQPGGMKVWSDPFERKKE